MTTVNLDELKAARQEQLQKSPEFIYAGKTYKLAPEIPVAAAERITSITEDESKAIAIILEVLSGLMGVKQYDSFMKDSPSTDDILALFEHMGELYGFASVGESSDSVES